MYAPHTGIPVFFLLLIRKGVHQMVDIHGYMDEEQRTKERIAELKALMEDVRGHLHTLRVNPFACVLT